MNLSAYDKTNTITANSRIYSNNNYPYIITREVKKRKYYCYVTKYDPKLKENNIFLVLLDDKPDDRQVCRVRMDNYGRLKFNLSPIREFLMINQQSSGVNLILDTHADDGDIYKLEIE